MPQHYWGAKAILVRLGWKPGTSTRFKEIVRRHAIPTWRRVDPRNKFKRTYYSSESALVAWEFANARLYREFLLAEQEEKQRHK
jgi:hypothetical protein